MSSVQYNSINNRMQYGVCVSYTPKDFSHSCVTRIKWNIIPNRNAKKRNFRNFSSLIQTRPCSLMTCHQNKYSECNLRARLRGEGHIEGKGVISPNCRLLFLYIESIKKYRCVVLFPSKRSFFPSGIIHVLLTAFEMSSGLVF